MSKTLGNVIDPLDTINEFGTDALRFTLALGTAGQVCLVLQATCWLFNNEMLCHIMFTTALMSMVLAYDCMSN